MCKTYIVVMFCMMFWLLLFSKSETKILMMEAIDAVVCNIISEIFLLHCPWAFV